MQTDIEAALIWIGHLTKKLDLSRRTIHRILARGELRSLQSDVAAWSDYLTCAIGSPVMKSKGKAKISRTSCAGSATRRLKSSASKCSQAASPFSWPRP